MPKNEISGAKHVQPCFVEPMQVAPVRELPDGGAWTYEAKLDGYRCLAAKRAVDVVLWSRRGKGFTERFSQIARACEKLPYDTLIDGEVIVIDENGRVKFNALQHKRPNGHIQFYAFDVLIAGEVSFVYPSRNGASCSPKHCARFNTRSFNPSRSM